MRRILGIAAVGVVLLAGCKRPESADLVLLGGRVVTEDDSRPVAEAVAVRDGRIMAVGSDAVVRRLIGDGTEVVDLRGRTALPGFIESHAHFMGIGEMKLELDLTRADSWEAIVEMVAGAAAKAKPGEWILGRGWHQEKWLRPPRPNVEGLPLNDALNAVSPSNPVLLVHASGHSVIANAVAMHAAGIGRGTPDPQGGEIVRDDRGRPIGVFRESAQEPLRGALDRWREGLPEAEREARQRRIAAVAAQECLSHGITSLDDAGVTFETIGFYRRLAAEGALPVRLYAMIIEPDDAIRRHLGELPILAFGDDHLTVRSIKRLIDGALGSHGAWLLAPYDSLPTSTGLNTEPLPAMRETAELAASSGLQLCTHAIGDRGNRETLDIYEAALAAHPEVTDPRWRVEHAQILAPSDIPRFGKLGVIAAMQGIHCTSDAPWVVKRIGEERAREGAYAWRSLLDSGAVIANGTDAPVEAVDPIPCFYASVTRRTKDGRTFFPDQRMTREEALASYTRAGAYAAFQEDVKGSLTPGKLADIVILDRDLLTVPDDQILDTHIEYTIVGGRILYRR